jgi:hypothetical protein
MVTRRMRSEAQILYYEGDDPEGFRAEIMEEFGFDVADECDALGCCRSGSARGEISTAGVSGASRGWTSGLSARQSTLTPSPTPAAGLWVRRTNRGRPMLDLSGAKPDDEILLTTARGNVTRIRVADAPRMGRATQGARLMKVDPGDRITAVALVRQKGERR